MLQATRNAHLACDMPGSFRNRSPRTARVRSQEKRVLPSPPESHVCSAVPRMSTAVTPDPARRTGAPAPSEVRAPGAVLQWIRGALRPTFLPNHYPALHGLRVLAIVLVVQLHTTWALLFVGVVSFSTESLWFGMDLFFLLSGFLIGSMLLAEAPSGRRVKMGRFYLRRTFRIFPPYFVVLTLFASMWPLNPAQRAHLWMEYAYLTNYVPPIFGLVVMPWGWSLALEEHFIWSCPFSSRPFARSDLREPSC